MITRRGKSSKNGRSRPANEIDRIQEITGNGLEECTIETNGAATFDRGNMDSSRRSEYAMKDNATR